MGEGTGHVPRTAPQCTTWVNSFKPSNTVEARILAPHHTGEGYRCPSGWHGSSVVKAAPQQMGLSVCTIAESLSLPGGFPSLDVLEDSDGPVSAFCPRKLMQAQCQEVD